MPVPPSACAQPLRCRENKRMGSKSEIIDFKSELKKKKNMLAVDKGQPIIDLQNSRDAFVAEGQSSKAVAEPLLPPSKVHFLVL